MTPPPPRSTLFPYTTLFRSILEEMAEGRPVWSDMPATINGEEVTVSACKERSEEHTSELQSRFDLVCRLLLEKKNGDELGSRKRQPLRPPLDHSSLASSS